MGQKHHKTEQRHKSDRDHAYFDRLDVQRSKQLDQYLDPQELRPPEVEKTLREEPGSLKPVKKRKK